MAGYNEAAARAAYQAWVAAGSQHGPAIQQTPDHPAYDISQVAKSVMTPWGENKHYDAAGNEISIVSPYWQGNGFGPAGGAPGALAGAGAAIPQMAAINPDAIKNALSSLSQPGAVDPNVTSSAAEQLKKRIKGLYGEDILA